MNALDLLYEINVPNNDLKKFFTDNGLTISSNNPKYWTSKIQAEESKLPVTPKYEAFPFNKSEEYIKIETVIPDFDKKINLGDFEIILPELDELDGFVIVDDESLTQKALNLSSHKSKSRF